MGGGGGGLRLDCALGRTFLPTMPASINHAHPAEACAIHYRGGNNLSANICSFLSLLVDIYQVIIKQCM